MKISAMHWLAFTTIILITVTIFATMNFSFSWVFLLTMLGQVMLIITVYKVLKDKYTTTKEFKDFYEDRPDLGQQRRDNEDGLNDLDHFKKRFKPVHCRS